MKYINLKCEKCGIQCALCLLSLTLVYILQHFCKTENVVLVSTSTPLLLLCFVVVFYLFTQDRTQMLGITHTFTPQTTTCTLRMEQPLMMVLTLNCKYYKSITYCTATESMTDNTKPKIDVMLIIII